MRKTFSLILSVIMVLSLFTVGAFAAEGTAINSADDFKNMTADGTYYLAADITVSETYAGEFTGTLDGNGKTVTVSAPMFEQMNGTVKNLTTAGAITVDSGHVGAVAVQSAGGKFDKVTNKATVTNTLTGADACVGGICGKAGTSGVTFTNCVNEAAVTGPEATGGICGESQTEGTSFENCINKGVITSKETDDGVAAGGILGYNGTAPVTVKNCLNTGNVFSGHHAGGIIGDARKSATVESCTNNGDVKLTNTAKGEKEVACAGGIIGYTFDGSTKVALTIDKCVNNGKVTAYIEGSALGQAGGIVGYVQNNKGAVGATVKNSINNGDVISGCQTGGIAGYVYGSKEEYITIENCINTGNISAIEWASPFVAYTNNNSTVVKNSISTGKLSALVEDDTKNRLCIVGLSGADVKAYTYENIFLADGGTAKYFSYANNDKNAANRFEMSAVLDKNLEGSETVKAFTRGELNADLITKANTAIGSELFALRDGKVVFASIKAGSTLSAGSTPSGGGSTPTGDTAAYVAVAAVAAVVILGAALVSKKRTIAE